MLGITIMVIVMLTAPATVPIIASTTVSDGRGDGAVHYTRRGLHPAFAMMEKRSRTMGGNGGRRTRCRLLLPCRSVSADMGQPGHRRS